MIVQTNYTRCNERTGDDILSHYYPCVKNNRIISGVFHNKSLTCTTPIIIPKNVDTIGAGAFSENSHIVIDKDNSIKIVESKSFDNSGITEFPFPNIHNIGIRSFKNNNFEETIVIPSSCKTLGKGAFSYCQFKTSIIINGDGMYFEDIEENIFEHSIIGRIYLNNIPCITKGMFNNCTIESIKFRGDRCKFIDNNAFRNCTFRTIRIPDGVTHIGNSAFAGCKNLKTIYISNSVLSIDKTAFNNVDPNAKVYIDNDKPIKDMSCFNNFKYGNIIIKPKSADSEINKGE